MTADPSHPGGIRSEPAADMRQDGSAGSFTGAGYERILLAAERTRDDLARRAEVRSTDRIRGSGARCAGTAGTVRAAAGRDAPCRST